MIHKAKHILFDLDGTIINSEASILNSVKYAMSELGLNSETIRLSHYIGLPLKHIFMQVLNTSDERLLSKAISLYRGRFAEHGFMENELYPEVLDTLYLLKQKAIKIYIATSKPTVFAKQILKYLGVINMFSEVYGSELNGENTDKTVLINYIINSIEHKRSEIMMIGDRKYDIIGAKNNRIMSAGVTYGYGSTNELMKEKPDYLFSSLSELSERI